MKKFNINKLHVQEETLAQKLNYAQGDVLAHHPGAVRPGKWFQFGQVALLKTGKKHAFSCMKIGEVYDLADYGFGSSCEELKQLLDRGESLGEAIYKQFNNCYDVYYYIVKNMEG